MRDPFMEPSLPRMRLKYTSPVRGRCDSAISAAHEMQEHFSFLEDERHGEAGELVQLKMHEQYGPFIG
jgi:hypothetical protein